MQNLMTVQAEELAQHMEEAGGLGAMSAARMGLHCWDSASLLCEYMAAPERAATFSRHRSVLELGAHADTRGPRVFGGSRVRRPLRICAAAAWPRALLHAELDRMNNARTSRHIAARGER